MCISFGVTSRIAPKRVNQCSRSSKQKGVLLFTLPLVKNEDENKEKGNNKIVFLLFHDDILVGFLQKSKLFFFKYDTRFL